MLKIRVLGSGVIPRSTSIAPRLDPFLADLDTIRAIIGHGGLKAQVLNPNNGKYSDLTYENLNQYWKLWGNEKPVDRRSRVIPRNPVTDSPKVAEPTSVAPAPKQISDEEISKLAQESANEYLQKQADAAKNTSQQPQPNNSNNKKNWDKKDEKRDEKKEEKKDDNMITVIPSTDKK